MADTTLRAAPAPANPVKDALNSFRIANCSPINGTGLDASEQVLPMIYSIATLLDMGFRQPKDGGEAAFENANPELVACAFEGIAQLAATALFRADSCNG